MSDFEAIVALVGAQMLAIGKELSGKGQRGIVTRVAVDAKKDIDAQVVKDVGTDKKFTNWAPRFGSGFEVTSDATAELQPRPLGPWMVLEKGRKGKAAAFPRGRRTRKVYRVAFGPGGLRTATREKPWPSGKTQGRRTFTKAGKEIEKRTPARFNKEILKGITRAMGAK